MRVPILNTEPPPEFGELKEMPEFHDSQGMDRDYTYVPGFSELRRARDLAIAEVMAGKRAAKDVPSLPLNFRWARCQSRKGEPDTRKVIRAGNRGYRSVTKDDVGPGKLLAAMPAGSVGMPDGTIRQGDTQLMVAPADRVARNEFQKRVRTESLTRGAIEGFAAAMASVKSAAGSNPTVEQETGPTTQAQLTPKPKK
jgi:hypothetical protein